MRFLVCTLLVLSTWLSFQTEALADGFGTNGVSCEFDYLQDAVDDAGPGGIVYAEQGMNQLDESTVITHDIVIRGSDGSCSAGGANSATLDLGGVGSPDRLLDITNGAYVTLQRISLGNGWTDDNGGLVRIVDSTLLMIEGSLEFGDADGNGGCIAATDSSIWLSSTEAIGCTAHGNGGNIWLLRSTLTVDLASVVRDGVSTDENGGNIAAVASDVVALGWIFQGFAGNNGGGIWLGASGGEGSTLTLSGDVTGNLAGTRGGGIYVSGTGSVATMVSDATVVDNAAESGAGAFVNGAARLELEDFASITLNTADDNGGGVGLDGGATLDLRGAVAIESNVAANNGGGIHSIGSTIIAEASLGHAVSISENTAEAVTNALQGGGGIRLSDSTLLATNLTLRWNEALAGRGGALLAVDDSQVDLVNVNVAGNNAGSGGGLFVKDSAVSLAADNATCDIASLPFEQYCSQVFLNGAIDDDGGTGRGGGVAIIGSGSLDARRTMFGYNFATVDATSISIDGAAASASLRNSLVFSDPVLSDGAAIDLVTGTTDIHGSTIAGHEIGLRVGAGTTAVMHRNIVADNTTGSVFLGTATGNCNLAQAAAQRPTGSNNAFGSPNFDPGPRSNYELGPGSTRAVDACGGLNVTVDIDGRPRDPFANDRGAWELQ